MQQPTPAYTRDHLAGIPQAPRAIPHLFRGHFSRLGMALDEISPDDYAAPDMITRARARDARTRDLTARVVAVIMLALSPIALAVIIALVIGGL